MLKLLHLTTAIAALSLAACGGGGEGTASAGTSAPASSGGSAPVSSVNAGGIAATPLADAPFTLTELADFEDPWAVAAIPGTRQMLVTEQSGRLMLFEEGGASRAVAGVPAVAYAGQGGLGDVALHPDFARNRMVYLSWGARDAAGLQGAVVARARLSDDGSRLENLTELWRQVPFVEGNGHYSHRIEFGPDGMLYIASGERQKFDPAQDMTSNLGKIIRLTDAGQVPSDNPFADRGGVAAQVWALGVRNPLGIAFDSAGRLWEMEMGPAGGDELNLIRKGGNYGYPRVSNGNHYDGRDIPDHAPGDGFLAPLVWWTPVISPSSLMIYGGDAFPQWRGNAFVSGLSGTALVRLTLDGEQAQQANRWNTGFRVRMVTQDATGGILLLGDGGNDGEGKLYRLTPRR